MDGFLQEKESESCLSCMWHAYWSSSSYSFEKRLTKRLTWDDAQRPMPARPHSRPDIAILKDRFF